MGKKVFVFFIIFLDVIFLLILWLIFILVASCFFFLLLQTIPEFIGVSQRAMNVRPTACFFVRCNLDSTRIQELYSKAQDGYESTRLFAVSMVSLRTSILSEFLLDNYCLFVFIGLFAQLYWLLPRKFWSVRAIYLFKLNLFHLYWTGGARENDIADARLSLWGICSL